MPTYEFQCQCCFIISGIMSHSVEDAPICCGGEPMMAIELKMPLAEMCKCGATGYESHKRWCSTNTETSNTSR